MTTETIISVVVGLGLAVIQFLKGSKYKKHVEAVTDKLFEGAKIGRETVESIETSAMLIKKPTKSNLVAAQKEFGDLIIVAKGTYEALVSQVKNKKD